MLLPIQVVVGVELLIIHDKHKKWEWTIRIT